MLRIGEKKKIAEMLILLYYELKVTADESFSSALAGLLVSEVNFKNSFSDTMAKYDVL